MEQQSARHQEPGKGGGFALGFVLGVLAGGVAAYLLTQEEARDVLVGKAREAGNLAMDATGDLRGKATDLYVRGKNVVENARSNVNAAVDEGHASADQIREDLSRQNASDS
jgi:hypothetical protein